MYVLRIVSVDKIWHFINTRIFEILLLFIFASNNFCKLPVVWAILRETFCVCVFVREELENKKCACVGACVHMRHRENFVCKYMCVCV